MAAGGRADIWNATYGGRKVVLKSYRCYMTSDVVQIAAVRCSHNLYGTLLTSHRGSATRLTYGASFTTKVWA